MRKRSRTKSIYWANRTPGSTNQTISTMLPLLQNEIATHAMVRHTMDIIKEDLNLDQPLVVTQINLFMLWERNSSGYIQTNMRKTIVLMMMGPLHIEMALLSLIGDWLESSGWVETLVKANISTSGKPVSFLKGNHPKRSRYAHQVTCALLESSNDEGNLTDWVDIQKHRSIQWMTLSEAAKSCRGLIKCSCKGQYALEMHALTNLNTIMY